MISAVIDTHAFVWHLSDDLRLSETVRKFIEDITRSENYLAVSSITFIEIAYLVEKQRLNSNTYELALGEVKLPTSIFHVIDVSLPIADSMRLVSRSEIPDMPDRIIAATAIHMNVPLITRDGRIKTSSVRTMW